MIKRIIRAAGAGSLFLALLVAGGCHDGSENDGPEPLTAVFELTYATYWGGYSGANRGNAIWVDRDGYMYVAGETQCRDFFLKNPIQESNTTTSSFISKFSPDGQEVVYSTYLGSRDNYNWCEDVLADDLGNTFAAGQAGGQSFPLQTPIYGTFDVDWRCGFLCGIASQGGKLNFSTFAPGRVVALARDKEGSIYLATRIGYLLKIAADGSRVIYFTHLPYYYHPLDIMAIAVQANGALVVAGWSATGNFPLLNPVQTGHGGQSDAFVFQLDPEGKELEFSTLLGGTEDDFAYSVAVGADGTIYLCGSTASVDFPLANAADATHNGGKDGFAARIDPVAGTLLYSTYLGGNGDDKAQALALAETGAVYLTGWTASSDFPVRGAVQDRLGGAQDAFITKLSMNGDTILLSTYLGGSFRPDWPGHETGADWANDICLGADGKICITGETLATDFPLLNPLDSTNSLAKAFIAVLREKQL